MPGLGFTEMLLLAGIALVVIGPEKFPDFAKVVVRTVRDLRGYMDEVKHELSEELKPIEKEMRDVTREDPRRYARSLTSDSGRKTTPKTAKPPEQTGEGAGEEDGEEPVTYGDGHIDGVDGQHEPWAEPGPDPLDDEPSAGKKFDDRYDFPDEEEDFAPPERLDD